MVRQQKNNTLLKVGIANLSHSSSQSSANHLIAPSSLSFTLSNFEELIKLLFLIEFPDGDSIIFRIGVQSAREECREKWKDWYQCEIRLMVLVLVSLVQ